jgi:hypothetical protein
MGRVRKAAAWAAVGAAAVALSGPAAGAGRGWPMRSAGGDVIIETPHYSLRTDLGADIGQTIATQQEVLYRELHRRMGSIKPRKMTGRFSVLAVGTYERYLSEVGADGQGSQGLYMPSSDLLAVWGPAERVDMILEVLRHEGTHQFVGHFIGHNCPVWLNEGLAVFYEHGVFKEGRLDVGRVPARRIASLKEAIEKRNFIHLDRMLRMSNQDWLSAVHSGSHGAGLQYDQAWSMVHFLAYGGGKKYQGPFLQYIYFVSRGRDSLTSWEKVFGANYANFEERWQEYILGLEVSGEVGCQRRLRMLGRILHANHAAHPEIKDIATFRQMLLEGKFGRWALRSSDGLEVRSDDKERLADLFRCPEDDRRRAEVSYELAAPEKEGEPPVIRCRHHGQVVLETRYRESAGGGVKVEVVSVPARSVR